MVSASKCLRSPVVSFLSASPASSRAAQKLVADLFSMEPIALNQDHHADDELDEAIKVPLFARRFDSVASKCPASGAVLHFLSLTKGGAESSTTENEAAHGHLSLLGVTGSPDNKQSDASAVEESRRLVASQMCSNKNRYGQALLLVTKHATGRPLLASTITRFDSGLPLLNLSLSDNNEESLQSKPWIPGRLKELVVPFYDDSVYPDGESLLSRLGSSTLKRPAVGLYQWPGNGMVIRPLPSAKEDRLLPAPSLVFYCEDLEEAADKLAVHDGAVSAKIGYNGLDNSGQLMMSHPSLIGLDIRLTDSMEYTSAFPEAQEALLASSIDELQNVNVLKGGGRATQSQVDARDNNMDCWVEFRANMKRPSGFLKRAVKGNGGKVRTTVKAPDIPYE